MVKSLKFALNAIILLYATSLCASMPSFRKEKESKKQECVIRGINDGMSLYEQGKFHEARAILSGSYYLAAELPEFISSNKEPFSLVSNTIFDCKFMDFNSLERQIRIGLAHSQHGDHTLLTSAGYATLEKAYTAAQSKDSLSEKTFLQNAHSFFRGNPDATIDYIIEKFKDSRAYTPVTSYLHKQCRNIIQNFADNGHMRAQCTLVKIYTNAEYKQPHSIDQAIKNCRTFILSLEQQSSLSTLPSERSIIPTFLSELRFSHDNAKVLLAYHNFLYADKKKDITSKKKAFEKLPANPKREPILELIESHESMKQSTLTKLSNCTATDQDLIKLFASDRYMLIPLLEQTLASWGNEVNAETDILHRILGIEKYNKQQFKDAREHFIQCTTYHNDLYLQSLLLVVNSSPVQFLKDLEISLSLLKKTPSSIHNKQAKPAIMSQLHTVGQKYAKILLNSHHYSDACKLTYCLMQLPETRKSACETFICIEKNIAQLPEKHHDRIQQLESYNTLHAYLQKIAKAQKHDSYLCKTLVARATIQIQCPWIAEEETIQVKKDYLDYASCMLKHKNNLSQDQKELCATYALEIGISEKSMAYLDQAIAFGNTTAYCHQATLLAEEDKAKYFDTIKKLIQKHAEQATDFLRGFSYEYLGLHSADEPKQAFQYFMEAAKLGHHNSSYILADYYIAGIKNDDDSWYIEPDEEQAREYLNQSLNVKDNPARTRAMYTKAVLDYTHNDYENARELCSTYLTSDDAEPIEKNTCLFIMGAIAMLDYTNRLATLTNLTSMITSSLPYFRQAQEQFESHPTDKYTDLITTLLHSKPDFIITMNTALKNIITHKINTPDTLDFCYIMSCLCGLSRVTNKTTDNLAVQALKYTAEHNHLNSQLFLQRVTDDSLTKEEQIRYLEKARCNNPELAQNLQKRLNAIYPRIVAEQARLIDFLITRNDSEPLLLNYIANMYSDNRFPITAIDEHYNALGQDLENIIKTCSTNHILDNCIKTFIKDPTSQNGFYATMFLGSLLSFSDNPQHLLQGAYYLTIAQKQTKQLSDLQNHVEYNLGIIYYKLAQHYHDNTTQKDKTVFYLQKSADLLIVPAQICLSELWLNGAKETQKIDKETIGLYLQSACRDTQDPHPHDLLKRYIKQSIQLIPQNRTVSAKDMEKKAELFMKGNELLDKLGEHPLCHTLLDFTKITKPLDPNFDTAIKLIGINETNSAEAFEILHTLARQEPPYAQACLMVGLYDQNLEALEKLQFIIDGITHGTTKSKEKNGSQFHNRTIFSLILKFIHEITSQAQAMSQLAPQSRQQKALNMQLKHTTNKAVQKIKSTLANLNINLQTFAILYKHMYHQDLTKHPGWK